MFLQSVQKYNHVFRTGLFQQISIVKLYRMTDGDSHGQLNFCTLVRQSSLENRFGEIIVLEGTTFITGKLKTLNH